MNNTKAEKLLNQNDVHYKKNEHDEANRFKLKINLFRSIKGLDLTFTSNYTVFTGENNTGKTNILRALSRILQLKEENLNPFLEYEKEEDFSEHFDFSKIKKESKNMSSQILYNENSGKDFPGIYLDFPIYDRKYKLAWLGQWDSGKPIFNAFDGSDQQLFIKKHLICLFIQHNIQPFQLITYLQEQLLNLITQDIEVLKYIHRTSKNTVLSAFPNTMEYKNYSVYAQGGGQQFVIILDLLEKIKEKVIESGKHFILLIDEPERGLHPKWMEEFSDKLKKWAKDEPKNMSIFITTHSYHFLNFTNPSSNYLVYKENGETKVKPNDDDNIFQEIIETLGIPYPDEYELTKRLFQTSKDNIFIVEGKTDKAHIENCIKLFPDELKYLFDEWEIMPAGSSSKVKPLNDACKKLLKLTKGFLDGDKAGKENCPKKDFKCLPKEDIELFTKRPLDFTNPKLEKKWEEFSKDKSDKNFKEYKTMKKDIWKANLTKLTNDNPDEARKYYNGLKDFLIKIHKK